MEKLDKILEYTFFIALGIMPALSILIIWVENREVSIILIKILITDSVIIVTCFVTGWIMEKYEEYIQANEE